VTIIGPGFKPGFLSEPQWLDDNFDPLALTIPGNNDAPVAFNIAGTSLYMASMPGGVITESIVSGKELNHDWKLGTSIHPHIHVLKSVAGAGNMRLGFEYRITLGDMAPIYGDIVDNFAVPTTHLTEEKFIDFGEVDISSISDVGAQITFRFYRLGTHIDDTYGGAILALSMGWHYQVDSSGSRTVGTK
jgi:hypothetical protein